MPVGGCTHLSETPRQLGHIFCVPSLLGPTSQLSSQIPASKLGTVPLKLCLINGILGLPHPTLPCSAPSGIILLASSQTR